MTVPTQDYRGALEAIERILNRGGDADDVLRAAVDVLTSRGGYDWVSLAFVEGERVVEGPSAGRTVEPIESIGITYDGRRVGALRVSPTRDRESTEFLQRVATLVSAHCLVAWDTGGEAWEP